MASISCSARSDDNYSYDDCYGTPAMNYWQAIPDSRPLCDRYQDFNWRPGTPAPTCVTDHEMDTRRSPCTKGETAKILREGTYDGGSQSGNMYDFNLGRSYGIQVFECR